MVEQEPGTAPMGRRGAPVDLPASVVPSWWGPVPRRLTAQAIWWRALLAGVVAVSLQVGVNYANDYSDGVRARTRPA